MIETISNWLSNVVGSSSLHIYRGTTQLWWLDFSTITAYALVGVTAFLLCNAFWFALKFLIGRMRK